MSKEALERMTFFFRRLLTEAWGEKYLKQRCGVWIEKENKYVCMCVYVISNEQETSNYARIFVLEVKMHRELLWMLPWEWAKKNGTYCIILNKTDIV